MARYTGPVCRLCRREQVKLFLKGDRCYTAKCPMSRQKTAPPGQHGLSRRKQGEYLMQLREKQKARRIYGVLERQFRRYFERAAKAKGVTGQYLLQLLETRLDNGVYRIGLAASRSEARQLVRHGHFTVNGRRVDIPSFQLRPGDVIAVAESSRRSPRIQQMAAGLSKRGTPQWLILDAAALKATVSRLPVRDEIDVPVQEHLIIELYSK